MKIDFLTKGIIDDLRGGFLSSLEYIWIIAALGVIIGFGTYTTLFGALILSFIFLVFYRNIPLFFSITIPAGISIAGFNVILGGRSSTLFAMLFVASFILIFTAFFKKELLKYFIVPKPVSHGFLTGCTLICLILCFPLFLGEKTFCSLGLMFNSLNTIFQNCDEFAIVITLLTFVAYDYLKNLNIKNLPSGFLSVIIAGIVNAIYGAPLDNAGNGFQNFKPVASGDFGHFFLTLFLALLLVCILYAQNRDCANLLKIKNNKRMLFLTGVTGVFGSISGFITGCGAPQPTKEALKLGGKSKLVTLAEFIILLFITLFFATIAPVIPTCSLGVILFLKCLPILKKYPLMQRKKYLLVKIVYLVCLISCLFNIAFGAFLAISITIFTNFVQHKRYN